MKRTAIIVACAVCISGAVLFFSTDSFDSYNPIKLVKKEVIRRTILADMGL